MVMLNPFPSLIPAIAIPVNNLLPNIQPPFTLQFLSLFVFIQKQIAFLLVFHRYMPVWFCSKFVSPSKIYS